MKIRLLVLCSFVLSCVAAFAQTAPADEPQIVQVIAGRARLGSEVQYLEARKQHAEFHRAQKDPWAWHVYNVVSGDDTGALITVSSPHKWADHDAREEFVAKDQAEVMKNLMPYALPHSFSFWRVRSDMSRKGAPTADQPPTGYATVQHFILAPEAVPEFIANVKRANAAQDKINAAGPKGLWYQLANGGEGPHFVLVTPRKNWAEMQAPLVDDVLKQAMGPQGAVLIANIRKAMRKTWTELIKHNDDLSYHGTAAH